MTALSAAVRHASPDMQSLVDSAARHIQAFKRHGAERGNSPVDDAYCARENDLVSALAEAENRVMNLPAANLFDLLVKVDFWAEQGLDHDSWTGDRIAADVRRLAGAA